MAYIVGAVKSSTKQNSKSILTSTGANLGHILALVSKVITTFSVLFFTSLVLAAELNLAEYNPTTKTFGQFLLPRNYQTLYRGTHEAQYHYTKAVRAMLDDQMANLESPMYAVIKELLMGRNASLFTKVRGLHEEFISQDIQPYINTKIRLNGGPYNEIQANQITKEILNTVYDAHFARTQVYDYTSPLRNDFPTAFIYSSVYIEVAKIYSHHVVIFKEATPRSLDVNFWNKMNTGKWVHTNNPFPDRGEFLTPFYIKAQDITGYQYYRRNYVPSEWFVWKNLEADFKYTFMKKSVGKTSYVYLLDATGFQHIMEVDGQFCSAYSVFNAREDLPQYTRPDCTKKPKVVAIFKRCQPTSKICQVPKDLFNGYTQATELPDELIETVQGISLNDSDRVVAFTANELSKEVFEKASPRPERHKRSQP